MAALAGSPADVLKGFIGRQPMGRLGKPAEIAALVLYLASGETAFTKGGAFIVDGGCRIGFSSISMIGVHDAFIASWSAG